MIWIAAIFAIIVAAIFLTRFFIKDEGSIVFDKTSRGFEIGEFHDLRGNKCSLQDSSLATQAAMWFGVSDPVVTVPEGTDFSFHPDTLFHDRMHLSQNLVSDLSVWLRRFVVESEDFDSGPLTDLYGYPHSVKKVGDTLIFGADVSPPQLMVPGQGWTKIDVPEGVTFDCKMHLDVEQVLEILNVLDHFVAHGTVNEGYCGSSDDEDDEFDDEDDEFDDEDDEFDDEDEWH